MYRILVVDDEEMIRSLIRKYAEFEGNQVTEAENGMEAVELCRRHPGAYDIIIMDGQRVELSPKEYDLLVYMAQNKNIALTREMLITNVWGYDFYGDDRTLDTHIKLLRRSLGPYSKFIVTLRGVGYRFEGK